MSGKKAKRGFCQECGTNVATKTKEGSPVLFARKHGRFRQGLGIYGRDSWETCPGSGAMVEVF